VIGPQRTGRVRDLDARLRRRLIRTLDVEARSGARRQTQPAKKKAKKTPAPPLSREELIERLGRATPEGLGVGSKLPPGLTWASPDPFPDYPRTGATYRTLLAGMHERLRPRTYLEIGVSTGESLTLSRARTIAVDPAYQITKSLHCDLVALVETSDDFFAMPDAFDHFAGAAVDLAFIDGMHLAEYALRDFMNLEKHMSPGGVVVMDDVIPRNSLEASRVRRTGPWAGDVFKVHEVLREHRPDLTLLPLSTEPTGSYMIVGLDPASTVLDEAYESLLPFLTSPDPQVVATDWAERRACLDPAAVLGSAALDEVVRLRDAGAGREEFSGLWQQLSEIPPLARTAP